MTTVGMWKQCVFQIVPILHSPEYKCNNRAWVQLGADIHGEAMKEHVGHEPVSADDASLLIDASTRGKVYHCSPATKYVATTLREHHAYQTEPDKSDDALFSWGDPSSVATTLLLWSLTLEVVIAGINRHRKA